MKSIWTAVLRPTLTGQLLPLGSLEEFTENPLPTAFEMLEQRLGNNLEATLRRVPADSLSSTLKPFGE